MKFKKAVSIICLFVMLASSPLILIHSHAASCPNPECPGTLVRIVIEAATCTQRGEAQYACRSCGYSTDTFAYGPLGHNYETETIEPTCTEDGQIINKCTRCGHKETETIEALGHDMVEEDLAPTCTEDGYHLEICTRCGEEIKEMIPALGHSYELTSTPATCLEEGESLQICSECGDELSEKLPALGHSFGEWVTSLKPTLFKDGLEERFCSRCGEKETRAIPKLTKGKGGVIGGTAAAVVLLGGGIPLAKTIKTPKVKPGLITLKTKTVLLCLKDTAENRELEEQFLKRPYLKILKLPPDGKDGVPEKAKADRPDLILLSCEDTAVLNSLMEKTKALYDDAIFAVIDETGSDGIALNAMKDGGSLFAHAACTDKTERKIAKLVLPLYKPDKSSDNYAENATLITDALGLPIISLLLNTFVVGGDVVEAVKAKGMGTADTADLVNDVAGLLGLDVLGNIAEALRVGFDQKERVDDKKETKEVK